MKNIEKKDIVLFVVLSLALLYYTFVKIKDKREEENTYTIVNNASTFFTIENCANKYIGAYSSSDKDTLLALLDDSYKRKNGIGLDNITDKLGSLDGDFSIKAKKMYKKSAKKNYTSYYMYGLLREDTMDGFDYGTDYYLIVTVDEKNYTFSITPYDGSIFKEGKI